MAVPDYDKIAAINRLTIQVYIMNHMNYVTKMYEIGEITKDEYVEMMSKAAEQSIKLMDGVKL